MKRILRPLGLAALLAGTALPVLAQDSRLAGPYLAAREADAIGDYAAVVEYGTRALVNDPQNQGLMEGLIMADIGLGKIGDAVPVAQRLASIAPDSQLAGLVLLADAMRTESWDKVVEILDGGTTVGGAMDDMVRAWAAIGQGRMSKAVEIFDKLAENPAGGKAALFQKALALALVGDFEEAAKIMGGEDVVLRLSRGGIIAYAQVLSQLERDSDALALIDKAFPETDDADLVALRADLAAGKAVPFTAVAGPREGLSELFTGIGESLIGDTDPTLILIYARLAQYLKPESVGATLLAAKVLEDSDHYALAADAYGQIAKGERAYPTAQLGKAAALRHMGKPEDGIAVLTALAQEYPEVAAVHAALGDALRFLGRYAEATPHYDRAIQLFGDPRPTQWATFFSRGVTLERQGRWDDAEADFREALKLSPDQPAVLNYLGYSYVEKKQNLDEALGMIQRAVSARPFDGYVRDSLGWVYYRLGRYSEALDEQERAVELMPMDPVLNDHLGDIFWAVDRKREAEFQWRRALSFVTDDTDLTELNPDRIRRKLEVGLDQVLQEEGGEPIKR